MVGVDLHFHGFTIDGVREGAVLLENKILNTHCTG